MNTTHKVPFSLRISCMYIGANLPTLMEIKTDLCYDLHDGLRDDGGYLRRHPLPGGECGGGQGPLWCDGGHVDRGHPFSV